MENETDGAYRARRVAGRVKQETRSEAKARKHREAEARNPGHTLPKGPERDAYLAHREAVRS